MVKSFDSIAFSFIKAVLQFFKFRKSLIERIMILLEDFTKEILHAGNIPKIIYIERGCKQEDPIASLLFILCRNESCKHCKNPSNLYTS